MSAAAPSSELRDALTVPLHTIKLHLLCLKHTSSNRGSNLTGVSHTCDLPSCTSNLRAVSFCPYLESLEFFCLSACLTCHSIKPPFASPTHLNFQTLLTGTA